MNIILIGMRGSGKTTIGQKLAKKLGFKFIDMDKYLSKKENRSISEIVKDEGWDKFRDIEEKIVLELSKLDEKVFATGGGVVLRKANIVNLKKNAKIFWLFAGIETLVKRIGVDPNRPSLTGNPLKKDLEITLRERENLYRSYSDYQIDTEDKNIDTCVLQILKIINKP